MLTRSANGFRDRFRGYKVLIDGVEAGKIRRGETLRLPVPEGRHTLQLEIDWCTSQPSPLVVANGQTVAFGCAPSDAAGGLDQITGGAGTYITLRPVADAADLAEIENVPHAEATRYLTVVSVGFVAGSVGGIGGGVWHISDAGSTAAGVLLLIGVVVWILTMIVCAVVKKVFEL